MITGCDRVRGGRVNSIQGDSASGLVGPNLVTSNVAVRCMEGVKDPRSIKA